MLSQNKKRLFDKEKSEYTFRSLNSIIESTKLAKKSFPNIEFDLIIIDYNSKPNDIDKIKNQLKKSGIDNSFISLNINDFKKILQK